LNGGGCVILAITGAAAEWGAIALVRNGLGHNDILECSYVVKSTLIRIVNLNQ
jgi:hypothetical protein